MPEVYIREAPEAAEIAAELIPEYHPHLRRARILYLFTTARMRRVDTVKLANAAKLSALQRFLSSGAEGSVQAGHDFIILISNDEWGFRPAAERRALVDHELQKCYLREKVTKRGDVKQSWALRAPDVEEFSVIIERHGLWRRQLRDFAQAAKQLPLETPPSAAAASEGARETVGSRA